MVSKIEAVKEIAKSNKTAEAVMLNLAMRERDTAETIFSRHKASIRREGFTIDDKEYDQVWIKLEKLRLGSIVYARPETGKESRFLWNYRITQVGAMAFDTNADSKTESDESKLKKIKMKLVNPNYEKRPVGRPVGSGTGKIVKTKVVKPLRSPLMTKAAQHEAFQSLKAASQKLEQSKPVLQSPKPEIKAVKPAEASRTVCVPVDHECVEIKLPAHFTVKDAEAVAKALMYMAKSA